MILGRGRPTLLLYAAIAVVVVALVLTFIWAKHNKGIVPAPALIHSKK
jgi:hypothetical protein